MPLIRHRVHRNALIDTVADVYAASYVAAAGMATAAHAASRLQVVPTPSEARRYTMTKFLVTSLCHEVLSTSQGLCGAHGMFAVNRFPLYLAVNRGCMTAEGDNTVIALAAAREMLHERREAPPFRLTGHPLPAPGNLDAWVTLAAAREELALRACRDRLAAARDAHSKALDIQNACSTLLLRLAQRHAHRIAVDELAYAAGRADNTGARKLIMDIAELHALRDLSKDAVATLGDGATAPRHLIAVDRRIEECHDRLQQALPQLIDALGIPDTLVAVPAATPAFVQSYLPAEREQP